MIGGFYTKNVFFGPTVFALVWLTMARPAFFSGADEIESIEMMLVLCMGGSLAGYGMTFVARTVSFVDFKSPNSVTECGRSPHGIHMLLMLMGSVAITYGVCAAEKATGYVGYFIDMSDVVAGCIIGVGGLIVFIALGVAEADATDSVAKYDASGSAARYDVIGFGLMLSAIIGPTIAYTMIVSVPVATVLACVALALILIVTMVVDVDRRTEVKSWVGRIFVLLLVVIVLCSPLCLGTLVDRDIKFATILLVSFGISLMALALELYRNVQNDNRTQR